jgi:LPS-assembly protein
MAALGLGVSVLALSIGLAVPVAADTGTSTSKPKPSLRHGTRQPLLFSADDVTYDNQLGIVIARGNVEISQDNRTLLADTVSYNQRTDTVIATGHVSLLDETGNVTFGDYVELSNDLKDGFIKNVRMLMSDRSRVAGNTALRTNGNRVEIRRGVYSPCDLCKDDPKKPPVWQLKAARMVHDESAKQIEYQDTWLELLGIPVLYTPYLSHPDPSVKRRSGFLVPSFGGSSELGTHATIPYYWVIAPDKDLLFDPILSTEEGLDLAGTYRQRFGNGSLTVFGSGTDSLNGTDALGNHTGRTEWRGNIDANGTFDLTDQLRASFTLDRASDQTYTRVYGFGTWDSFLTSDATLEDFDGRNYGAITAYSFQSLRLGVDDKNQAIVAPIADYTWYGRPTSWGGRFTTSVDAMNLVRESGPTTQRVSLGTEFDRPFTLPDGELWNTVLAVRGDAYYATDNQPTGAGNSLDGSTGRVFPQLGLEWRYPLAKRFGHSNLVIEPMAALYAAPVGGNSLRIPNNDSQAFEFTDADLFQRDRLYGYDQVDGGQRVDYALHAAWSDNDDHHGDALFGQSYRFQKSSIFGPGTGLEHQASDYVGRVSFSPNDYIDLSYHFRLDQRDMRAEHQGANADFGPYNLRFSLGYIDLSDDPRDDQSSLQQLSAGVTYRFNDYWSISLNTVRDLGTPGEETATELAEDQLTGQTSNNSLNNSVAVTYTDECLTFELSFAQSGISDRDVKPGDTILFEFVFKNLGEISLPSIKSGGS